MKKLLLIAPLALLLTSCSVFKRTTAPARSAAPAPAAKSTAKTGDPVFIDNISLKSGTASKEVAKEPVAGPKVTGNNNSSPDEMPPNELNLEQLQFKYAILMDVPVESLQDFRFLRFMESWYGTKYRMGGNDKSGIDCSAFVQTFMSSLYNISLPRTSKEQYMVSGHIIKAQLKEGDLVFFKTIRRKGISHVGIYIGNNKFAHASTSNGVTISDLADPYYSSVYAGAGRVIGLLSEQ